MIAAPHTTWRRLVPDDNGVAVGGELLVLVMIPRFPRSLPDARLPAGVPVIEPHRGVAASRAVSSHSEFRQRRPYPGWTLRQRASQQE